MKLLTNIILLIMIGACSLRCGQGLLLSTQPPSGSLIANFEGARNTILVCNISSDGTTQISTTWSIQDFRGIIGLTDLTGSPEPFIVGGPPNPLAPQFSLLNELTVSNWTADLDGTIIFCGTGQDQREGHFFLRVYRPSNLRDDFMVVLEENSENIPVDLRQDPPAFPEPTMFTWYRNGVVLNGFDQTYSNLTFGTITRENAANYTVSATNFVLNSATKQVGTDTGSFNLNVIYGPTFQFDGPTQMPTQRYVLLGNRLSLVCGRGLDSNPEASIIWTAPGSYILMDNDRYDLESGRDIVRLNFTRTILGDAGIWTCYVTVRSRRHVVSDGRLVLGEIAVIGISIRHEFMVNVIDLPGQPVTLRLETIGATWIKIIWGSPLVVQFPISRYEVTARATENPNIIIRMSTPNNNTFINVTNLIPGTAYNFTVVAVIEAGEVVARGVESASLRNIRTGFTVPNISCPRPVSRNGNITASWTYVHTGGLPLTDLSVMYSYEEGALTVSRSVGVNLNDLSVTVSGLVAGEEYTFTVTAENSNGSSSTVCEPVNHIIGIPAAPQFGELIMGPDSGVITVQIKTVASGVNTPSQGFQFRITPILAGVRQASRQFQFPLYISGELVSIRVVQLEPGASYVFIATAMNNFGTSAAAISQMQVAAGASSSTGLSSGSDECAVIGGVLGSLLFIAIVIIVILMILLISKTNQNKAKSASNENEYENTTMHMSSVFKDPKMEKCSAYGVIHTRQLF